MDDLLLASREVATTFDDVYSESLRNGLIGTEKGQILHCNNTFDGLRRSVSCKKAGSYIISVTPEVASSQFSHCCL